MPRPNWGQARDANEKSIIRVAINAGATVDQNQGGTSGRPDLTMSFMHRAFEMEIKNPDQPARAAPKLVKLADLRPGGTYHVLALRYGDRAKRLKETQVAWFLAWRGPWPDIVYYPYEALWIIGASTNPDHAPEYRSLDPWRYNIMSGAPTL